MSARRLVRVMCAVATLALVSPVTATAVTARTTLPTMQRQVMCVTCKIPLNTAESPQADRERALIQKLIDQGLTEGQIKRALVAQYGPAVLALPAAHGFDLAAYLVPILAVAAVALLLAFMLPRWRKRTEQVSWGVPQASPLSAADAARLDQDLARHEP